MRRLGIDKRTNVDRASVSRSLAQLAKRGFILGAPVGESRRGRGSLVEHAGKHIETKDGVTRIERRVRRQGRDGKDEYVASFRNRDTAKRFINAYENGLEPAFEGPEIVNSIMRMLRTERIGLTEAQVNRIEDIIDEERGYWLGRV
jgi:hypothetical protein